MNRRKFLIAMGAVPVAAYFANAPALKAISTASADFGLLPWQQRLWQILESGKKVMYVTGTQRNAWSVYNLFQRHRNLFTTHINAAVMGRQANLIVVDDFNDDINIDWYNTCVRTRLTPEGTIEWIHT